MFNERMLLRNKTDEESKEKLDKLNDELAEKYSE